MQAADKAHGPLTVLGLGLTNQRETTVVWRRSTGQPLYNAIVWLDTRTRCDPMLLPPRTHRAHTRPTNPLPAGRLERGGATGMR